MLGIILTGHGGFASGLEQAMKQILGEQPQFIAIDFPETSTTARLTAQLEQAVSELDASTILCFSPTCSAARRFAWRQRSRCKSRAVK
jgi:PTS system N-acetylgalactosamine-specific IIA component